MEEQQSICSSGGVISRFDIFCFQAAYSAAVNF